MLENIEAKFIKAINRYCGFKIMSQVASCYMDSDTVTSCFNWFCSSLRNSTNVIVHYSDGLDGMGEYLIDKCRVSFYEVYNSIVTQLKRAESQDMIQFLFNCLNWKMSANDHKFIHDSDIVSILKDGNSHHQIERNLIKQSWYQDIDFQQYFDKKTLTHTV